MLRGQFAVGFLFSSQLVLFVVVACGALHSVLRLVSARQTACDADLFIQCRVPVRTCTLVLETFYDTLTDWRLIYLVD